MRNTFDLKVRVAMTPSERSGHRSPAVALDLDFTPIGIALELPCSSRPKTEGSAKRVLHELHVPHLLALQPAEDGK